MSAPVTSRPGRGAVIPRSRLRRNAGVAAQPDVRLQACRLVGILTGELAKRRRDLPTAPDGELRPEHVGVRLRCSWRDSESVRYLDVRAALRNEVHDLPLSNCESCVAIKPQHASHTHAWSAAALLAVWRIFAATPSDLAIGSASAFGDRSRAFRSGSAGHRCRLGEGARSGRPARRLVACRGPREPRGGRGREPLASR